ncbi:D-2-hydroxyacid dehydrogenase [Chelatococcus sp. GCM10030263]|uniref:D-2-hydroxyacid dehydrogenase n=1 Tax=Chelatococcus sp. GCM10030263 TaxID=3273387 RepID=UPI0036197DE5
MTNADDLIHFLHPAYDFAAELSARQAGLRCVQSRSFAEALPKMAETDILVVSSLWTSDILAKAPKLKWVQSPGAGYDQFDLARLKAAGIKLSHASGLNANAVSEHALALILTFTRQLHLARDRQRRAEWRGMITLRAQRESELKGKLLLVVGLGVIGMRIAQSARWLGMNVVGVRRRPPTPSETQMRIVPPAQLHSVLPEPDFVVLACPLTPETRNLMGAREFGLMKQSAVFVNISRGACVDQAALTEALARRAIAGAALDCFVDEPLPASAPLWAFENVVITPHSAGERQNHETEVIDLLLDNLQRLRNGDELRNQVI